MNIVKGLPPNYDAISKRFKFSSMEAGRFKPVFAYGDILYNPLGSNISIDLMVHEETHKMQQERVGGPERWWEFYLDSDTFRLEQELEAYQAQYQSICLHASRNERRFELNRMANDLSSALYGNIIKKKDALALIAGETK